VAFSDGVRGRYDLVIGADGLYSKVRETLFPDAPKPPTAARACGVRCCRVSEVNGTMMWLGPKVKTGLNPVSRDQMYLFVTEDRPDNGYIDPSSFVHTLRACWRASRRR
jgi:2-polyprenyl-6-methoxyphenol hydroxylase-like FAD-dependent oxidoreductase